MSIWIISSHLQIEDVVIIRFIQYSIYILKTNFGNGKPLNFKGFVFVDQVMSWKLTVWLST